jgi:hypothetical protein
MKLSCGVFIWLLFGMLTLNLTGLTTVVVGSTNGVDDGGIRAGMSITGTFKYTHCKSCNAGYLVVALGVVIRLAGDMPR